MNVLYKIAATSHGGRDGQVTSEDGVLKLTMTLPKELGGKGGDSNPEQLFAAAYAACFHGALKLVAGKSRVDARQSTVNAEVAIGTDDQGGFMLGVKIRVTMPGVDHAKANEVAQAAHQVCPYSRATRGNIAVEVTVAP